jgi:hypothetical protein
MFQSIDYLSYLGGGLDLLVDLAADSLGGLTEGRQRKL